MHFVALPREPRLGSQNVQLSLICPLFSAACRRDVWHGDDMAGAGQRRARWNEALLDSTIAPAYATLIEEAARLLGPCSDFWRLLPGQGFVPEPWLRVSSAAYQKLAGRPVLYSPVNGGKWLAPQQSLLPDAACYLDSVTAKADDAFRSTDAAGLHAGPEEQQPGQAALQPPRQHAGTSILSTQLGYVPPPLQASVLAVLLVQCGVPLVMGLSPEQQQCLLQWGKHAQRVGDRQAAAVFDTL